MGFPGWLRAIVYALTHPREFLAALRGRLVVGYRVPAPTRARPRASETGSASPAAAEPEAKPGPATTGQAWRLDAPEVTCAANRGEHDEGVPHASAIRPRIDDVHFSVTAPAAMPPDSDAELRFWAHLDTQREEVLKRAMREAGAAREDELAFKSEGPFPVARGSRLSVRIEITGMAVAPSEKPVVWDGSIGSATFLVSVPAGAKRGAHAASASIRLDAGEIARMDFLLNVGEKRAEVAPLAAETKMHRTAFASYASEDRDQVIARVQGMQAAYKGLEVFVDVASLRAGQDWEAELRKHIAEADVFYLFWCRHAKESEWVGKEWHWAIESRGKEFIDPVPLEDPALAAPPPELAQKHFNDPWLAYVAVKAHSCGA